MSGVITIQFFEKECEIFTCLLFKVGSIFNFWLFIIYQNHEHAKLSLFKWIETWYNRKRRHSALGYKTI
ncbi:MAG: hypothetical protein GQ525_03300 [Draconibacterium sp.]|nr:hypothetical protein [Draconibacterium sp.]